MVKLGRLRNEAVHRFARTPDKDVGESALYTAIEASRAIYDFFNKDDWDKSEYSVFANRIARSQLSIYARLWRHKLNMKLKI